MVNTFTDPTKELINAAPRPQSNPQKSSKGAILKGDEFKPTVPELHDSDPDFDEHRIRYKSALDTLSLNKGKTPMPWDLIQSCEKWLPAHSIRLATWYYNAQNRLARSENRIPHDAKEVLEELKDKLRVAIVETQHQKETRVEDFNDLAMSKKSHAFLKAK